MFPWLRDSWLSLLRIFSGDREPHSILLYGKDGLGQEEIAREHATFYLCFNKCGAVRTAVKSELMKSVK